MFDFGFGIGGGELLLVAMVAIVVIGPKDLPKVMRALGKTLANLRSMGSEFQRHLDDAMKDSGLDEVRREVSNLKQMATAEMSRQSENFLKAQQEVAAALEKDETPEPPTVANLPAEPVQTAVIAPAPLPVPASAPAPVAAAKPKKAAAKKAAPAKPAPKKAAPRKAAAKKAPRA